MKAVKWHGHQIGWNLCHSCVKMGWAPLNFALNPMNVRKPWGEKKTIASRWWRAIVIGLCVTLNYIYIYIYIFQCLLFIDERGKNI
jgi:hypothetical protein